MKLYIMTSCDKYELPVAIASSWNELSQITGISVNSMHSRRWHYRKGELNYERFICVDIGDIENDDI